MNTLILTIVLIGGQPDRQVMVDEMLSFVYMVNGSEIRQTTESKFDKLNDREISQLYTNFQKLKRQMGSLFTHNYPEICPEVPIKKPKPNNCKTVPFDKNFRVPTGYRVKGWEIVGPRGASVFVSQMSPDCERYNPLPTVPSYCNGYINSVTLEPIPKTQPISESPEEPIESPEEPIAEKPCKNCRVLNY